MLAWYLLGLLVCTAPRHFVPKATTTAFSVFGDGFHPIRIPAMYLHTAIQLVFALSFCGVLLVFLGGVRKIASVRTRATALVVGVLALFWRLPFSGTTRISKRSSLVTGSGHHSPFYCCSLAWFLPSEGVGRLLRGRYFGCWR